MNTNRPHRSQQSFANVWPTPRPPALRVTLLSHNIYAHTCLRSHRVDVGAVDDFPINGGAAVLISQSQIAVFRHDSVGAWYATQNLCPHKQLQVLSRGILGMENGVPKVACPIHKNTYKLDSGRGISTKGFNLSTFEVRVLGDRVSVLVPPAAELDVLLAKPDPQSVPAHDCSGGCGEGSGGIADIEDLIGGPGEQRPRPPPITAAV